MGNLLGTNLPTRPSGHDSQAARGCFRSSTVSGSSLILVKVFLGLGGELDSVGVFVGVGVGFFRVSLLRCNVSLLPSDLILVTDKTL